MTARLNTEELRVKRLNARKRRRELAAAHARQLKREAAQNADIAQRIALAKAGKLDGIDLKNPRK